LESPSEARFSAKTILVDIMLIIGHLIRLKSHDNNDLQLNFGLPTELLVFRQL
jgi:hypothetical protein